MTGIYDENQLTRIARDVALSVLDISFRNKIGHVGSALSVSDLLTVLYFDRLNISANNVNSPKRDRFILSKGHAATALYAVLFHKGILTKKQFNGYGTDGGLCEHPEIRDPGVEMTTGSLGHGLAYGAGIALGLKKIYDLGIKIIDKKNSKLMRQSLIINRKSLPHVYVLISDGECGEGSVWEAALFAARMKLDNLTVILDYNRWQCFGRSDVITPLRPVTDKWRSFGWNTVETDGHDIRKIRKAFIAGNPSGQPRIVIAHTISGHGVPLIENRLTGHYKVFDRQEYETARKILAAD